MADGKFVDVRIEVIPGGRMPERKTSGAACFDCYARVGGCTAIEPGCRDLVPLGFAMELPEGYEAVIRPRSGFTAREIDCGIGTIDSDYRGEVMVCLINSSDEILKVCDGDRVCQMAVREVPSVRLVEADRLSDTERGEGGFGSTGI